jgi:FdhD protein
MAVTDHPLAGLGYTRVSAARSFVRLTGDSSSESSAEVAEEVPVALVYNGRPYVVVMGTPNDLDDLAVGFSITEGIVADAAHVEHIDAVRANHGIELQIQISPADAERLGDRVRGMVSRTGCGLCGVETIGDALRLPSEVGRTLRVERGALWRAGAELSRQQSVNNATKTSAGTTRSTKCSERSRAPEHQRRADSSSSPAARATR